MLSGETLGFKTESKKSDVAKYFKKIHDKAESTKTVLNKIVVDMEREGNPNVSAVKTKVEELINNKLGKIMDGASVASDAIGDAGESITYIATGSAGGTAGDKVDKLVEGELKV